MYTAVMIASAGGLEPPMVEALRNAWGGGEVRWLSPDEAAEFDIERDPPNRAEVWQNIQEKGVDLAIVPSANRRKKLLIADMDSTIIQQECIDELAAEAGVKERVSDITARAMNGELDFAEALKERVALLRGLDESVISTVLEERITLMPGAETLVATMKANDAFTSLVSGGFTIFTAEIAARVGFDENRGNTLLITDGTLTGKVVEPILGSDAKQAALRDISESFRIPLEETLAVGDGANDLAMLKMAGLGVALHAKPSVAEQADIRIEQGDLTALLYLQGYARDEFV